MPILKNLYKIFCEGSKAWAYAKMCQKTGMAPPYIDIWLDVYKNSSKVIENQAGIYLKKLQKACGFKIKPKTAKPQIETKAFTRDTSKIFTPEIKQKIINSKTFSQDLGNLKI